MQAGDVLADAAACGLVLWRDVDLVLKDSKGSQRRVSGLRDPTREANERSGEERVRRPHRLAVGGAVDAAGVQQVEAAAGVQAAAALPAVAQAAVVVLHQRLAWPQNAALAQHAHRLAHWKHTRVHTLTLRRPAIWP